MAGVKPMGETKAMFVDAVVIERAEYEALRRVLDQARVTCPTGGVLHLQLAMEHYDETMARLGGRETEEAE
jgi:hypothetical protein